MHNILYGRRQSCLYWAFLGYQLMLQEGPLCLLKLNRSEIVIKWKKFLHGQLISSAAVWPEG